MPIGEELFEDLREQGREQGMEEGAREGRLRGEVLRARAAVIEAFDAHFDHVSASFRAAVAATEDLALLRAWHRLAIRAEDVSSAEKAVLGTR